MPKQIAQTSSNTALVVLVLLYPGFALYHYGVANGWYRAVLGGMYGNVSVGAAVVFALLVSLKAMTESIGRYATLVGAATGYYLVWSIFAYFSIQTERYAENAIIETLGTLIQWIAIIAAGYLIDPARSLSRKTFLISGAFLVAITLHAMYSEGSATAMYRLFSNTSDSGESGLAKVTYQGIGRSLMVTAILAALTQKRLINQLLILATGSILIMLLQARSEFFGLLLILGLVSAAAFASREKRSVAIWGVCILALAGFYAGSIFSETRNAEIKYIGEASSWQMRVSLAQEALHIIAKNPFTGDFGYHQRDIGEGGYAHNALSAWTQFGIIGFLLLVLITAYFAVISFSRAYMERSPLEEWHLSFYLNVLALFLMVTSVPVFSPVPVMGWGFAARAWEKQRLGPRMGMVSKRLGGGKRLPEIRPHHRHVL
jgi:hypothetical protein